MLLQDSYIFYNAIKFVNPNKIDLVKFYYIQSNY